MNKIVPFFLFCFFLTAFEATAQQADALIPPVNGQVGSIIQSGDTVYIGGNFTTVGGLPRKNLAAFNTTTGQVLSWAPNPNNIADVIGISAGNLVVQGSFDTIAGQQRNSMAQFNIATGNITSWQLDSATGNLIGISSLYNNIIYTASAYLTAIDATSGVVLWSNSSFTYSYTYLFPSAIEVSGDTIYFAADKELYAVDRATGKTIYWSDTIDQEVIYDIAAANGKIYIAGTFDNVNNVARTGVAQLDMNGNVTSWNAYSTSHCLSLAVQGNYIYVGGFFSSIGQNFIYDNYRLGKLDITTAYQACWDINKTTETETAINLIYTYDTMVYISGSLTSNGYLFSAANSPCANLCLTVQGESRCPGINGSITVSGSETGVTYQAYSGTTPVGAAVAGTGSTITLTIPAASLNSGSNVFTIQAATRGCTAFLKSGATITITSGTMPTTSLTTFPISNYNSSVGYINFEKDELVFQSCSNSNAEFYYNNSGVINIFNPDSAVIYTAYNSHGLAIGSEYIDIDNYEYELDTSKHHAYLTIPASNLVPGINPILLQASNSCGTVFLDQPDTLIYITPGYLSSSSVLGGTICQGDSNANVTIANSIKQATYYVIDGSNTLITEAQGNGGNLAIKFNPVNKGYTYLNANEQIETSQGLVKASNSPDIIAPGPITVVATVYDPARNESYTEVTPCFTVTLTNQSPLIVIPAPSEVITLSGRDTICVDSSVTLHVKTGAGYTYQWYEGRNSELGIYGNGIPGATSSTYKYTNTGNDYTQQIMVSVKSATGCTFNQYYIPADSNSVFLYVNPFYISYVYTITTSFCSGDSVLLESDNGWTQFQWLLNDTIIPNATNSMLYATENGYYSVISKGLYGCPLQPSPLKITENPLPVALVMSIESGFIDSSVVLQSPFPTGQTFSWSPALELNDSTLASPSFTPLQNGIYSFVVKTTDNNGCSSTDTVKVNVTGVTGTVKGTGSNPVKVYPNPYSGFTNITYQLNEQSSVTAEVFNIIGESLSQFVNETQEAGLYHYQFSGAASGMYIIKIIINNKEYYQKIVQQ